MRFILTNDDGYDAPGLAILKKVLPKFGDLIVVAPATNHSYAGHRVSVSRPMAFHKLYSDTYILDGTPVDCIRVALAKFGTANIDWVISGVNYGCNVGLDIFPSGTVAAAREASHHGVKAIAISQVYPADGIVDWSVATLKVQRVLAELIYEELPDGAFFNVNLPLPPIDRPDSSFEIRRCDVDYTPCSLNFITDPDSKNLTLTYSFTERLRVTGLDVSSLIDDKVITVSTLKQ